VNLESLKIRMSKHACFKQRSQSQRASRVRGQANREANKVFATQNANQKREELTSEPRNLKRTQTLKRRASTDSVRRNCPTSVVNCIKRAWTHPSVHEAAKASQAARGNDLHDDTQRSAVQTVQSISTGQDKEPKPTGNQIAAGNWIWRSRRNVSQLCT